MGCLREGRLFGQEKRRRNWSGGLNEMIRRYHTLHDIHSRDQVSSRRKGQTTDLEMGLQLAPSLEMMTNLDGLHPPRWSPQDYQKLTKSSVFFYLDLLPNFHPEPLNPFSRPASRCS